LQQLQTSKVLKSFEVFLSGQVAKTDPEGMQAFLYQVQIPDTIVKAEAENHEGRLRSKRSLPWEA